MSTTHNCRHADLMVQIVTAIGGVGPLTRDVQGAVTQPDSFRRSSSGGLSSDGPPTDAHIDEPRRPLQDHEMIHQFTAKAVCVCVFVVYLSVMNDVM